ncbi:class I SAM-dependent methyltransferase [Dyella sp. A6]|uniref:class I SAM-dependent methyltransferase n=1 Tax=Dyella aluminiiresistens TaxID=3069105 RepID=UPI002E775DC5|nr:class I SAM-dependent methyltransferase [Dyella sp. A6]
MPAPSTCPVCTCKHPRLFMQVDGRSYWRCENCMATFLDPSQLPDLTAERAEYQLHRNEVDDPGYRRFLSRVTAPLLARLEPGQSGLDYGCGPGPALAAMLEEAGHGMTLYDPLFRNDPAALARSYDFVTCTEVAEHFHRPAEEFARLDGLLKPDGWLALMTIFQTDDQAFAGWHYRRDPTHVVFYREQTLRHIAARMGWHCEIPCANVALFQKAG